jgi:hypothetical protein
MTSTRSFEQLISNVGEVPNNTASPTHCSDLLVKVELWLAFEQLISENEQCYLRTSEQHLGEVTHSKFLMRWALHCSPEASRG